MAGRNYGTDPYGIISRGDPSARGGSSVSVGRVGSSVRDYSNPGRTVGTGIGVKVNMPLGGSGGTYKPETKGVKPTENMAKGGAAKSGCEVKAYGDMIKKAAGGKVQTSSDTARKLATEMGGMKKGGIQKKAVGGAMYSSRPQPKPPVVAKSKTPVNVKTFADMVAEKNARPTVDRRGVTPVRPVRPTPPPVTMKGPPSVKTIADALSGKARPVAQATDPRRPMPTPPVRPTPPPPVRPGRPTPMPVRPDRPMPKPVAQATDPRVEQAKALRAAQAAKDPRMMAKGGAGKVRKGMMSPQGAILQVVKPKKGGM